MTTKKATPARKVSNRPSEETVALWLQVSAPQLADDGQRLGIDRFRIVDAIDHPSEENLKRARASAAEIVSLLHSDAAETAKLKKYAPAGDLDARIMRAIQGDAPALERAMLGCIVLDTAIEMVPAGDGGAQGSAALAPQYYTTKEVMKRLSLRDTDAFYRLRDEHGVGSRVGRCWRFTEQDIADLVSTIGK